MSTTYDIDTKRLFKSLSISLTVIIVVTLIFTILTRFLTSGFDFEHTFKHLSLTGFLITIACSPLAAIALSGALALMIRLGKVTLDDHSISGRNYWFWKNKIPLNDIKDISTFSSNGINCHVVKTNSHGSVYISEHTQNLPDLLTILNRHLPEEDRVDINFQF